MLKQARRENALKVVFYIQNPRQIDAAGQKREINTQHSHYMFCCFFVCLFVFQKEEEEEKLNPCVFEHNKGITVDPSEMHS